ncbi:MAG: hypothetical protein WC959_05955 [Kiritimatiellales bacterium]
MFGKPAIWLLVLAAFTADANQGYPRLMSFRTLNSRALEEGYYDQMGMVVTDLHTYLRKNAALKFKRRFPDRLALIQINMERLGLWGSWESIPPQRLEDLGWMDPSILTRQPQMEILHDGRYPLPGFLGWWAYNAGDDILNGIPAGEASVTVKVTHPERFRPSDHILTVRTFGSPVHREVVFCPRDAEGNLDWLSAEAGVVTALDEAEGTITVRRWKTSVPWKEHAAGTYVAPHAVDVYISNAFKVFSSDPADEVLQPWLPNLTRHCPRDPRNGQTACEWLADWYAQFKKTHYSQLDGMVFDVSAGTFYPSDRVSVNADCNLDGDPDAFFLDGVNWWPLGMYDFFYTLRQKLKNLNKPCVLVSDSNHNEDQRFFDLLNGAEYEYSMNPVWYMPETFSSMLDRLLLWESRSVKPAVSFLSNKYPDHIYHGGNAKSLTGVMTLSHWRMDLAVACIASAYAGKDITRTAGRNSEQFMAYAGRKEQMEKYRYPLPPVYDEYHAGGDNRYNWLGAPDGPAQRVVSHLGPELFSKRQAVVLRADSTALWRTEHDSWQRYETIALPGVKFEKDAEYALSFSISGSNPWKHLDNRYAGIPKNSRFRFCMNGVTDVDFGNFKSFYAQEALVFEEPRACVLTLKAPAAGRGELQVDLSENTGDVTISNLTLRKGCADVLLRKFENGLVIMNGSYDDPVTLKISRLFPGESYSRILGRQVPEFNDGQPVGEALTIQPHDGIFLKRNRRQK